MRAKEPNTSLIEFFSSNDVEKKPERFTLLPVETFILLSYCKLFSVDL